MFNLKTSEEIVLSYLSEEDNLEFVRRARIRWCPEAALIEQQIVLPLLEIHQKLGKIADFVEPAGLPFSAGRIREEAAAILALHNLLINVPQDGEAIV